MGVELLICSCRGAGRQGKIRRQSLLRTKRSGQSNKKLNHRDVPPGEKRGQEGCGPEGEGTAGKEEVMMELAFFPGKHLFGSS